MKLILLHILLFALAFMSIYIGVTKTIKYIKKLEKYKDQNIKLAICVGMILLSISVTFIGIYLLYTEIESFIRVNK